MIFYQDIKLGFIYMLSIFNTYILQLVSVKIFLTDYRIYWITFIMEKFLYSIHKLNYELYNYSITPKGWSFPITSAGAIAKA